MIWTIACLKTGPLKIPPSKSLDFKLFYTSNGRILDPNVVYIDRGPSFHNKLKILLSFTFKR